VVCFQLDSDLPPTDTNGKDDKNTCDRHENGLKQEYSSWFVREASVGLRAMLQRLGGVDINGWSSACRSGLCQGGLVVSIVLHTLAPPDHTDQMLFDLFRSINDMLWVIIPYNEHGRVLNEGGKVMPLTAREKGNVWYDLQSKPIREWNKWEIR